MHGSLVFVRPGNTSWEFSEIGKVWQELENANSLSASEALEEVGWIFPRATIAIGSSQAAMRASNAPTLQAAS